MGTKEQIDITKNILETLNIIAYPYIIEWHKLVEVLVFLLFSIKFLQGPASSHEF